MYKEKISSLDDLKKLGYQIEPTGSLVNNHLKDILGKRNMTIVDLAEKTGVSRQTLHNIENETFTPNLDLVLKIATVLGLPVEDIFMLNEKAWFSRVKRADERTLYVDAVQLFIMDKEAMDDEIQRNGMLYYDNKTGSMITSTQKEQLEQVKYERILNNPEELYALVGENRKMDKRSLPRLLKSKIMELGEERFIPKYQKIVKILPR